MSKSNKNETVQKEYTFNNDKLGLKSCHHCKENQDWKRKIKSRNSHNEWDPYLCVPHKLFILIAEQYCTMSLWSLLTDYTVGKCWRSFQFGFLEIALPQPFLYNWLWQKASFILKEAYIAHIHVHICYNMTGIWKKNSHTMQVLYFLCVTCL